MRGIDRREALKAMALMPFAVSWDLTAPQIERASRVLATASAETTPPPYVPKFFTKAEWATVMMLADYIIPKDERSGSASEAKVPEYIDWLMADKEASLNSRYSMRGGLAWLDRESYDRFGSTFVGASDLKRRRILDDIAWPKRAKPEHSNGVAFFNRFRDLTASGFFSSEMGYKDVKYIGNTFNPNWNGCPPEAMAELGVSQDDMKTRVPVQRS